MQTTLPKSGNKPEIVWAYLEKAFKYYEGMGKQKASRTWFRMGDQVLIKLRLKQIRLWGYKDQRH